MGEVDPVCDPGSAGGGVVRPGHMLVTSAPR